MATSNNNSFTGSGKGQVRALALAAALALSGGGAAWAEEGGSGHYVPGTLSSFIDGVPAGETFLMRVNAVHYKGDAAKNVAIPFGGATALGVNAKSSGLGLTMLWRPPIDLGANWSYATSATLSYLWMDVSASAAAGRANVALSSKVNGLGDLILMPVMLNQNINPDFNINYRLTLYAPTGNYEVGRLANTGKNFWTVEPVVGFMYLGKQNGFEASAFMGASFNQENSDTQYKSGTQFHLDGTLAQHFPLWNGLAGVGINGYYYKQVTDDSGAGATLGAFRGQTTGMGPVVSYAGKMGGNDIITEFKWIKEFDVKNRVKGDTLWFKFLYKFY